MHMRFFQFLFAAGFALSLAAQTPAPSPAAPPPPAPVNHDFDFWIGEWVVTTPDGKPAGTSRIERVSGGHGLLENWQGAPPPGGAPGSGGDGKSLNAYNAAKKQWQQFWIGSGGGVLELAGGLQEGKMILSADHAVRGKQTLERITWTPNADGSVRQHWEQSTDAGKTWTTAFDGLYRKKA